MDPNIKLLVEDLMKQVWVEIKETIESGIDPTRREGHEGCAATEKGGWELEMLRLTKEGRSVVVHTLHGGFGAWPARLRGQ
jgi:hypothetical protein